MLDMKKRGFLFLFLFCMVLPMLHSTACYAGILESKMVSSDKQAYINGMPIHCYEFNGEAYIIAEDLAKYGFGLHFSYGSMELSISHDSYVKVYVTTELEDRGQQCFDLYETNVVAKMHEEIVPSYNIDGQTAIPIKSLEYYGNVIFSEDGSKIFFEATPAWDIIFPEDHTEDTSKAFSHFKLEMTKNDKNEWIETGENKQYLYAIVAYWEKPTKMYVQIMIPKTLSEQSEKIRKLFENNPDLNSKEKSTQEAIALANQHTAVYINGEKANITGIKYEQVDAPNYGIWLYLDKDLVSPNDLQTLVVECDAENPIKAPEKSTIVASVSENTENKAVIEQSTNYDYGYFAEKDNFLYYFKDIGTEQKVLPQLFRYDLKRKIETNLSQDIFTKVRDIRVGSDGYVYFSGISIYDVSESKKYYRIPANGGKSELFGENLYFLSDTWYYDVEKNAFCNVVTKDVVQNTVTEPMYRRDEGIAQILERDNVVYFSINPTLHFSTLCYQNGEELKAGVYALPIYQQTDFAKVPLLDDTVNHFTVYQNTLYYGYNEFEENRYIDSYCKAYSLQDGTTKTISQSNEINVDQFVIYQNTLYYRGGEYGFDLYALPLDGTENAKSDAVLGTGNKKEVLYVFENTICHANIRLLSKIGPEIFEEWSIENYRTNEKYNITPYTHR